MKTSEIRNFELRTWAERHIRDTSDKRPRKVGSADLVDIWEGWSEADWHAFRQVTRARAECERLGHTRDDQARAVARVLDRQPGIVRNGNTYRAPWTLAIEAEALSELARIDHNAFRPAPPQVVEIDL